MERNMDLFWVNLLRNDIFKKHDVINLGKGGASNQDIFYQASSAIAKYDDIDYIICQWTSYPRYTFEVGLETYDTSASMKMRRDYDLNDRSLKLSYTRPICDRFISLIYDYGELVKITEFINTLNAFGDKHNIEIIHINGLCVWDEGFFDKKESFLSGDLSPYTQELLNTANRDDDEIFLIYDKLFGEISDVSPSRWVNLYDSFRSSRVDYGEDNRHPGIASNEHQAMLVKKYVDNQCPVL